MKSKKHTGRIIGMITVTVLAVLAVIMVVYRKAVYMTFKNLTVAKLKLDESVDEWDGGEKILNVPYAEDSESQYLDLYIPAGVDNPDLYVIVHGGGFIAGDSRTRQAQLMYRYFRDHGYACASINYRLAQEEPFPGALEDVKAAVRFLRSHAEEYGYNADHISIFGESAGGYLATMAALTNDDEYMSVEYIGQKEDEEKGEAASAEVSVLVDYYGVAEMQPLSSKSPDWKELGVPPLIFNIANSWMSKDALEGFSDCNAYWMRRELSEMSEEELSAASAAQYIDENLSSTEGPAVLIIHGDCDITVPILQSERLYERAKNAAGAEKVEFWVIPDQGHATDMLYEESLLEKVKGFIEAH